MGMVPFACTSVCLVSIICRFILQPDNEYYRLIFHSGVGGHGITVCFFLNLGLLLLLTECTTARKATIVTQALNFSARC